MLEPISYTTIFRHILPVLPKSKQLALIQEIENAFGGGIDWSGNRILFLKESEIMPWLIKPQVDMPQSAVNTVVRLGLVEAYQQNEITPDMIGEWLDNYQCLCTLNAAINIALADGVAAPCWEHAFDTLILPGDSIDVDKVLRKTTKPRSKNK